MRQLSKHNGYSLIEVMVVVAVIGVLAAIATVGYQEYTARSRAADILTKYDAIRSYASARLTTGATDNCAALAKTLGDSNLADPYANLSYGFEAAPGGYRPVLNVCAKVDQNGNLGVKVAKGAFDTMNTKVNVEKNPVVTDSMVSFALPLSAPDKAFCKTYTVPATPACAAPAAQAPTAQAPAAQVPVAQVPVAQVPVAQVPVAQQVMTGTVTGGVMSSDTAASLQSWLGRAGIRNIPIGAAIISATVDPPGMASMAPADSGRWAITFHQASNWRAPTPFTITFKITGGPPGVDTVVVHATR